MSLRIEYKRANKKMSKARRKEERRIEKEHEAGDIMEKELLRKRAQLVAMIYDVDRQLALVREERIISTDEGESE